jgi:mono/diheme cytochrome c family protein
MKDRPLPAWLLVLSLVVLGTAAYRMASGSGGFHALVYKPYHSTNELERLRPKVDPAAKFLAKGRRIFSQNCAPCHQDNGEGDAVKQVPPLAGSEWVAAPTAERLIRIVLNGLQGPLTVKGQTYPGVAMIPWRDVLSDEEIAAVLTYARRTWGGGAGHVTKEVVLRIRDATRARQGYWTEAELLNIPLAP